MGLGTTEIFKIALPGILRQLGLSKWLRERGLHIPQERLADCVADVNRRLIAQGQPPNFTPQMWRAMEACQSDIVGDGITARITPQ